MYKILNWLTGNNETNLPGTKLAVKYHLDTGFDLGPNSLVSLSGNTGFAPSTTVEDFERICKCLDNENDLWKERYPQIKIQIELSGKLNGRDINEKFDDLNLFKHFLKNNRLANATGAFDIKSEIITISGFVINTSVNAQEYMEKFSVEQLVKMMTLIEEEVKGYRNMKDTFNKKINELFKKDFNSDSTLANQLIQREIGDEETRTQLIQLIRKSYECQKLIEHCLPTIEETYHNRSANNTLMRPSTI